MLLFLVGSKICVINKYSDIKFGMKPVPSMEHADADPAQYGIDGPA